ncbi:MAG TPA: YceI family protein, partial [Thermoleophilaceae bacterium]|nr:YceI family protein [Thermoleophilaceae bacterium]
TFGGAIDARKLWTGEPDRDAHLRSSDFFDFEREPTIAFDGRFTDRVGDMHFKALVDLTIRGVTRKLVLDVAYLGQWETPYWVGDENRGSMLRIGFEGRTVLNRHDFGVSWQDEMPGGGVVVSNEIALNLDVEAINDDDLRSVGQEAAIYEPRNLPTEARAGSPEAGG